MARRNQNTFYKRQKEIKRKQVAEEKMARRHGKKKLEEAEDGETSLPEEPEAPEQGE